MIGNNFMNWLEGVSNRRTDRWMKGTDKSLIFRRFFVLPEEFMDWNYLLRRAGQMFSIFATVPLFAWAFMFVTFALTTPSLDRRYHIPVPSLAAQFSFSIRVFATHWLMYVLMTLAGFLLLMTHLTIRAYFWNRRARRLRANPPMPPVPIPGVWPPPPRIAP